MVIKLPTLPASVDRSVPICIGRNLYKRSVNFVTTGLSHTSSLVKCVAHHNIRFGLIFHCLGLIFYIAQDGAVLRFLTFLQIILDFYQILYIRVPGLRLLKFRSMRLICCVLIRDGTPHCPVGFLGQMYNRL